MEHRQNVVVKSGFVILALAVLAAGAGITLRGVLAQSGGDPSRKHVQVKVEWLKEEAEVDENSRWLTPHVTVQLSGLREKDYVNIRPSEGSKIEATAGAIPNLTGGHARQGESLPKSALKVSRTEVAFERPPAVDSPVVLDIQIPSGMQTKVIADSDVILSTSLREPLCVRGRQVGQGVQTISAAMAQTVMPSILPSGKSTPLGQPNQNAVRPLGRSGKYMVPFDRLQVLKRVALAGSPLETIASLEIDETGRVVKVHPMSSKPAPGLEEALKQWEFAPYQVDGRPVRVITQLTPEDQ